MNSWTKGTRQRFPLFLSSCCLLQLFPLCPQTVSHFLPLSVYFLLILSLHFHHSSSFFLSCSCAILALSIYFSLFPSVFVHIGFFPSPSLQLSPPLLICSPFSVVQVPPPPCHFLHPTALPFNFPLSLYGYPAIFLLFCYFFGSSFSTFPLLSARQPGELH